jgi:hypothetical protein
MLLRITLATLLTVMPEDIRVPSEMVGTEIAAMVAEEAALAINVLAEQVYLESQVQVPKSGDERTVERHGATLAESGVYPGNQPELGATPAKLEATVGYDSDYAHAQHEGFARQQRENGEVEWHVAEYTTPGTKSKFLEDPFKGAMAQLEEAIGMRIKARLGL